MSYDIDTIHVVSGVLRCDRNTFEGLKAEFEDSLPEYCFLRDEFDYLANGCAVIEWCDGDTFEFWGEGSGHYDRVLTDILLSLEGTGDLVLVWEGGDSFSGLRKTLTGVIEDMDVRLSLE